ncbi:MAG: NAD(+) synthase [Candidatus Coprovivens sp.]
MNKKYGYVRYGAVVPEIKVANVTNNVDEIIKQIKLVDKEGIQVVAFPELSLTGYTCGDLFKNRTLLNNALEGLERLFKETANLNIIAIVGLPLLVNNLVYNVAVVVNKGKVLGIVPKNNLTNEEHRWFNEYNGEVKNIKLLGEEVLFGNVVFKDINEANINFGINIGEELNEYNGVSTVINITASYDIVGKHEYRKNKLYVYTKENGCNLVYVSGGVTESTTDYVYSGYAAIYEVGKLLVENDRYDFNSNHIGVDVDNFRVINNNVEITNKYIEVDIKDVNKELVRHYNIYPFIPEDEVLRKNRFKEIINIQALGLARRLKHIGLKKCVMGISGGLDSTLAFLIVIEAYRKLGISNDNFIGVTMPGFGTTGRTYNNALSLMKKYGITTREVSIKDACLQHFKDIGLDENDRSVTYENSQARERTQILMDIANQEGALVVGTGDLSELILGWCTYNGDHMSMYCVNGGVPKTLVRHLVGYYAEIEENEECKKTILDILDTPISPELLPPDKKGNIKQQTESLVGPYVLHDFFLYHFLRYGASVDKVRYITLQAFDGMYTEEEINKWLTMFVKRFFSQQFKRSCLPDGPKIGTVGISPRGDLVMPSDASYYDWL